jgi:hypothetical protein
MRIIRNSPAAARPPAAPADDLAIVRLRSRPESRATGRGARLLIGLLFLALTVSTVLLARYRAAGPAPTESVLGGAWELTRLASSGPGADGSGPIVSQRVRLEGGRIRGETRLRTDTEEATISMPFPDRSVSSIITSPDGRIVTVTWDGSFELLRNGRMRVRIGQSSRILNAHMAGASLTLDGDLILNYAAPVRYARATSSP